MLTTYAGAPSSQILCRQTVAGTGQPVESIDDENGTNDAACDKRQVILDPPAAISLKQMETFVLRCDHN